MTVESKDKAFKAIVIVLGIVISTLLTVLVSAKNRVEGDIKELQSKTTAIEVDRAAKVAQFEIIVADVKEIKETVKRIEKEINGR